MFNVDKGGPLLRDNYSNVAQILGNNETRNANNMAGASKLLRSAETSKLIAEFRQIAEPTEAQFLAYYDKLNSYDPAIAQKELATYEDQRKKRTFNKVAEAYKGGLGEGDLAKLDDQALEEMLNNLETELKTVETTKTELLSGGKTEDVTTQVTQPSPVAPEVPVVAPETTPVVAEPSQELSGVTDSLNRETEQAMPMPMLPPIIDQTTRVPIMAQPQQLMPKLDPLGLLDKAKKGNLLYDPNTRPAQVDFNRLPNIGNITRR